MTTGPVAWEALVDTYYMYNFTGDPSTQAPALRAFDNQSNSFTLSYAKLAASMNADPVGFRIDLGYGHTGSIINNGASLGSSGTGSTDPRSVALYVPAFIVQQAYATAKFGILTLDAGKFVTSASDEVIETKSNWNYSRSLLFNGVPFVHTGLRLGLKVSDQVSLQGSVVNGWNNDPDNNGDKTFGLQVAFTPLSTTSLILTSYLGKENPVTDKTQVLVDLVAAHALTDSIALSLNADYFTAGDNAAGSNVNWWGVGLKGRFILSDMFNLAGRFEYLKSKNGGYSGVANDAYEFTVTGVIPVKKNYEIRAEVRGDLSGDKIFYKGSTPKSNQFTGLIGFLAWLP